MSKISTISVRSSYNPSMQANHFRICASVFTRFSNRNYLGGSSHIITTCSTNACIMIICAVVDTRIAQTNIVLFTSFTIRDPIDKYCNQHKDCDDKREHLFKIDKIVDQILFKEFVYEAKKPKRCFQDHACQKIKSIRL